MRIATWNINGMKARLEYVPHFLREVAPDLLGLQELKMTDAQFPHEALRPLGYHAVTHGQKSWNGVAVLSREPVEVLQAGLPGQEEMGARLLSVRAPGGLRFTTVYCPNGKSVDHADYGRKLEWFDALGGWVESLDADADAVLCGDFNIVPAPIDSWDEARLGGGIFHTEAERARFGRLLDHGLHDAWRRARPDDPGHSWWDYRAGAFHKRQGLRIDLVLTTGRLAERVVDVGLDRRWRKKIDGLVPSDHTPVWVDLGD